MNELHWEDSRKLFCNSDKLFYDNLINLDDRLNVNNNFNENKYEDTYDKIYLRNNRRFKTEPPKTICEQGGTPQFYSSFFHNIFKNLSKNISYSGGNIQNEENVKIKKKTSPYYNDSRKVKHIHLAKRDSRGVTSRNKNNLLYRKTDSIKNVLVKNAVGGKSGDLEGRCRRHTDGNKRSGHCSHEDEEAEKLETEDLGKESEGKLCEESGEEPGEASDDEDEENSDEESEETSDEEDEENSDEEGTYTKVPMDRGGNTQKDGSKSLDENRNEKKDEKGTKLVNSDIISDVFLRKSVKCLVVHDTGGIDIELIENENPEFLYHTYTGNRISNMYYEYDDSIKSKEFCDDKKINRFYSSFSRNENMNTRGSSGVAHHSVKSEYIRGDPTPNGTSSNGTSYNGTLSNGTSSNGTLFNGSAANQYAANQYAANQYAANQYAANQYAANQCEMKNTPINGVGNGWMGENPSVPNYNLDFSTDSKYFNQLDEEKCAKNSYIEDKIMNKSNEVYYNEKYYTRNENRNKVTVNSSVERSKMFDSYSSVSSVSINTTEREKRKKYYYIGETVNNVRNGWGMLISNDRVIFEGEYKMNNAIGYFIKYNEYSTEIGYRSPLSVKSVVIMSDSDNFIIQNRCENIESVKNNELVASQDDDLEKFVHNNGRMQMNGKNRINYEGSIIQGTDCENKNEMTKGEINLLDTQKFTSMNNCTPCSDFRRSSVVFTTSNSNKLSYRRGNVLMNNYINSTRSNEYRYDKRDEEGEDKFKNLNIISSYVRKNSKHKTTPARSINYLKPPMMNLIKNNLILNRNSRLKSEKSSSARRKKEHRTMTHCSSPMSIIITSFDSDDESDYFENDENKKCEGSSLDEHMATSPYVQPATVFSEDMDELKKTNKLDKNGTEGNYRLKNLHIQNNNPLKDTCSHNTDRSTHLELHEEKQMLSIPCQEQDKENISKKECLCHTPVLSAPKEVLFIGGDIKQNEEDSCECGEIRKDIDIGTSHEKRDIIEEEGMDSPICFKTEPLGKYQDSQNELNALKRQDNLAKPNRLESLERQDRQNRLDSLNKLNGLERLSKLNIVITDEYRNLICENINNDNFVIKNNEITTFDEFLENQGYCDEGEREKWRDTIRDQNIEQDNMGEDGNMSKCECGEYNTPMEISTTFSSPDVVENFSDIQKGEGNGWYPFKSNSTEVDVLKKKGEKNYEHLNKTFIRRRLRGATFPEAHDDRQKNCFLFIDDYLTSNDAKFDMINEDVKLRASDYNKWSVNMLYNFLKMIGLKKEAYLFKIHKIRGYHILKLTDKELKKLSINNSYVRKFVLSVFRFLVNSLDSADPLSLNFNSNKKFSFNKIKAICSNDIIILNKVGGGSYAQVFKAKYRGRYVACKLFLYNPKDMSEESYCESYISTPRSSHKYIFPKINPSFTMFNEENFANTGSAGGKSDIANRAVNDTEREGKDRESDFIHSVDSPCMQLTQGYNEKNVADIPYEKGLYTSFDEKKDKGNVEYINSTSYTLQRNKKIKKMANLEIFRYFPTPVKYRNYEAKILYSLQGCDHVIKLFGVCSLREGEESLILQYCAGGSLEKYIYMDEKKKNCVYIRCLSRPQIVKIFQQVAEGMHNVHCNNFFHRDLKLSNILLDDNQDAVISDFGLSTHFSSNDSPTAYAIYGNIFYAAPEVLKGEGFFKESDVWSFGVSLWEALTKKIAYDGLSASETFCKVSSGELILPIPKDIPLELSNLLRSMLEYDFTKRPLFNVIAKRLEHIRLDAEKNLHVDIHSFFDG
ncbi:tyrosine kinase-like protein [Plasmodium gonderi]|uniref:Tyrosine kinase-like protein n=1 Tax=Plasmodium gonderi TaxID=77519 RepID=A0A1Y1JML0_PLAGO|nr:tyrosine kinase-like protein [Plasmodium gonderi]GAW82082.1 tyrosine kinase-like protein [Plasmodium gonderi]